LRGKGLLWILILWLLLYLSLELFHFFFHKICRPRIRFKIYQIFWLVANLRSALNHNNIGFQIREFRNNVVTIEYVCETRTFNFLQDFVTYHCHGLQRLPSICFYHCYKYYPYNFIDFGPHKLLIYQRLRLYIDNIEISTVIII